MSSIVETIKKIVENEIAKLHIAEPGVVTSIFPHSSPSDKDNYECNVKLKYRDLELRKVPIATPRIGLANIPNVGDMVLLTFINGNINSPVVVGRLYTDEDRPPVNKEEEIVYVYPSSKNSSARRLSAEFPKGMVFTLTDNELTVEAGKTTLKLKRDGDIQVDSTSKVILESKGDFTVKAMNVKIESQANMELKAGASLQMKATGTGELSSTGPLTIKGITVDINPD